MSRRSQWVPNQHGAWAMLALPFILGAMRGAADGEPRLVLLPLAGVWFVGYFAFFFAGLWLKSRRRTRYLRPMVTYALAATVLGVVVLVADWRLVLFAPVFVPFLGLGLWASAARTERSVLAGGAMVAAASLMTVVAYVAGRPGGFGVWQAIDRGPTPVLALAALVFGYFFGTVLYVKSLIRERGVRAYAVASVGYHVAITVAAVPMALVHDPSWWAAVVFLAVMAARAWALVRPGRTVRPLSPKVLGIGEMVSCLGLLVVGAVLR